MKVLMLGPSRGANGGIASVVNQYFEANIEEKIDLKYIETTSSGSILSKIIIFMKSIMDFNNCIKEYDIVHIHMSKGGSFFRKYCLVKLSKKYSKKIIIHIHSSQFIEFYIKSNKYLKKRIINAFDLANNIIVLSEYWKNEISPLCDERKIVVLKNGVKIQNESHKDYNNNDILFLGKICKEKGMNELLYALSDLVPLYPNLKLYIGGIGSDDYFSKLCNELNIQNNVVFLGWITGEEKTKYLKSSSIFVLPSHTEGLPVSLLEAMSYGCACITTSVGGIPEVIQDGINGIMIEPKNEVNLKTNIEKCIKSPQYKRSLGDKALNTISDEYNINLIKERLIKLYCRLIQD